jgi:hypothetical protein
MIFTVIIALEFKKSLLVVAERRDTGVQIRSVCSSDRRGPWCSLGSRRFGLRRTRRCRKSRW